MLAGVNYPERAEERTRPGAVESPGPPGSSPVERAGRKEPRQPAVQPGLAPVAGAAEPLQVLQGERSPERLRSHRPCDVDGKPVVELRGGTVAALAHRDLDAEWLLSGCDAVCRKAVVVPGEVYGGGVLVAPATDAADRRLAPARGPCYKSPGMRRGVSPVVQHQSPETSLRILFLMLSMLSSPLCDRLPSVRRRAHPNDLVYVPEVAVRGDQVRAGLHRVCCDPDVVCRDRPSPLLSDAMILE